MFRLKVIYILRYNTFKSTCLGVSCKIKKDQTRSWNSCIYLGEIARMYGLMFYSIPVKTSLSKKKFETSTTHKSFKLIGSSTYNITYWTNITHWTNQNVYKPLVQDTKTWRKDDSLLKCLRVCFTVAKALECLNFYWYKLLGTFTRMMTKPIPIRSDAKSILQPGPQLSLSPSWP